MGNGKQRQGFYTMFKFMRNICIEVYIMVTIPQSKTEKTCISVNSKSLNELFPTKRYANNNLAAAVYCALDAFSRSRCLLPMRTRNWSYQGGSLWSRCSYPRPSVFSVISLQRNIHVTWRRQHQTYRPDRPIEISRSRTNRNRLFCPDLPRSGRNTKLKLLFLE